MRPGDGGRNPSRRSPWEIQPLNGRTDGKLRRMNATSADNWHTRSERVGEAPTVRRINLSASDTAWEADLVDALRADSGAWLPRLSYLALPYAEGLMHNDHAEDDNDHTQHTEAPAEGDDGDEPAVGYALLTRCHIGTTPALALAPCAVHPEHQGRGAGTAVIEAVLAEARAAGERTVVVLGHPTYYPRFGFTPCARHGIKPPADQKWPDDAFLALSLDGGALPRGTVRYAPAFGL